MAPSTFSWLDNSERDRRRALDVIDLFRQRETRDELGIGTVRDAIADLLNPGTSTIQTRARYFFFIPWTYLDLERRHVSSADVARRAREAELDLIDVLAESTDRAGTLGIEARRKLKRLPSAVYWGGLGTFGIRLFPRSQDQYHRSLDRFYREHERIRRSREDREADVRESLTWHPHLPLPPSDYPRSASFKLTRSEAQYLQDRVLQRAPGTLLAFLVDRGQRCPRVGFAWDHPQAGEFPTRNIEQLAHARHFSQVMHGAALLYNLMLATLLPNDDWADGYREDLRQWMDTIESSRSKLASWDRRVFWTLVRSRGARIPSSTQSFAESWISLVLSKGEGLSDSPDARNLIERRERALKGKRSRLASREMLELWNGAAGTAQLDYRWGTTQTIVSDILEGLARREPGARAA